MTSWQLQQLWENGGWPMWPLAILGGVGAVLTLRTVIRLARQGLSNQTCRDARLLAAVSAGCVLVGFGCWYLRLMEARELVRAADVSVLEREQLNELALHYLRGVWMLGVVLAVPPFLVAIGVVLRCHGWRRSVGR